MFYLSVALKDFETQIPYRIENEQQIETLALTASIIPYKSCVFLDNLQYLDDIGEHVTMVITTSELAPSLQRNGLGTLITENPRMLFFLIHNHLKSTAFYARKKENTHICKTAQVSPLAYVAPSNVSIGEHVIIEPFVTIYENTVIDDHAIIRSGARIGSEGFEFKLHEEKILSVAHLGGVLIGNNAEIQNNTCVDKAVYPWDNTVIGAHAKIDNLVHIGHGAKIGKAAMVVALSGIGGRTIVGEEAWIGFGATLRNGLTVGEQARVNMGAVATKDVPKGQSVTGNFAIEHSKFIQHLKNFS